MPRNYKQNRKGSIAWHLKQHEMDRERYGKVVAEHLARNRQNEQKILDDAFKITELENQLAVTWRNWSEAKDDLRNIPVYQNREKVFKAEIEQLKTTLGRVQAALGVSQ